MLTVCSCGSHIFLYYILRDMACSTRSTKKKRAALAAHEWMRGFKSYTNNADWNVGTSDPVFLPSIFLPTLCRVKLLQEVSRRNLSLHRQIINMGHLKPPHGTITAPSSKGRCFQPKLWRSKDYIFDSFFDAAAHTIFLWSFLKPFHNEYLLP